MATRTLIPGYPVVMKAFRKSKPLHQYAAAAGRQGLGPAAQALPASTFWCSTRRISSTAPADLMATPTGADWPDNWRRFAALSQAGADIAAGAIAGYRPDLVHAHDWQAALTLAYMRYGAAVGTPSVITVHNLAFQGQFGAGIFGELGLPATAMSLDGVEYYGGVGYLKAGLQAAWAITTVSPTYAQEIRTPRIRHGARRAGQRCARPTFTASSTASTSTSGIRRRTRI